MNIKYEDFQKIDLRVVKVLEAEKVEDSEKLLRLKVDLGEETRQIVAGIAKHYQPEELINKQVVIVANLEPRTIFGHDSNGMILAAGAEYDKIALITCEKEVSPGSKIR